MGQKKRWRVRDLGVPGARCAECAWFIPNRVDKQAQGECFKTGLPQIIDGVCKLWEPIALEE